jgi:hypothetical protein
MPGQRLIAWTAIPLLYWRTWTVLMAAESGGPDMPPVVPPEPSGDGNERMTPATLVTLLVTNLIKLAGVVVIIVEVTKPQVTPIVLLVGGFMVAGGQGAENLIGSLFGQRPGEKK